VRQSAGGRSDKKTTWIDLLRRFIYFLTDPISELWIRDQQLRDTEADEEGL
jgi:hypothetical protein